MLPDIFAFNNINEGFNKFENDFNGFRELMLRNNALGELLESYKVNDPNKIPTNKSILEKGNYVLRFSFLELFAARIILKENLSLDKKKEFVKELLLKKEKKKLIPEWYGGTGLQTNIFAIVKIIQSDTGSYVELNNSKLTSYIYYTGNSLTPDIQNVVNQSASKFLNKKQ